MKVTNALFWGFYAASSGNNNLPSEIPVHSIGPVFKPVGPILNVEDGTDRLCRNVRRELPLRGT
jgi:hypothetical protein